MKKSITLGIIVMVLLLAVGFAAVTTQLLVNGTINIAPDTNDFETNVQFYSATATGSADSNVTGDADAEAEISSDGKTITFTTQILDQLGEESVLSYDIDNQSTYDAKLGDMLCSLGNTFDESNASLSLVTSFVTITSTNELKDTVVGSKSQTENKGTVVVRQTKTYDGSIVGDSLTFTCKMIATAQAAA